RRRHTRSKRDWSSDVCSSDLGFGQLLLFYEQYNVYFAALKVSAGLLRSPSQSKIATRFAKGSPWMGPRFAWMDQVPRGPRTPIRSEERRVGKGSGAGRCGARS